MFSIKSVYITVPPVVPSDLDMLSVIKLDSYDRACCYQYVLSVNVITDVDNNGAVKMWIWIPTQRKGVLSRKHEMVVKHMSLPNCTHYRKLVANS